MSDVFQIQAPDGRIIPVRANSPEEAAQGARNMLAREKGAKAGDSQIQAAGNAFTQGATFGFADELAAAVRSVLPEFMFKGPAIERDASLGPTEKPLAPQGGYEEELNRIRAQGEAERKNFPATTTAANIAGNVATSALALPAAATAVGPSLAGNITKGAAVGAGLAGVQGFGEGEGGFTERAGNAAVPAAFGAAGGAAVPIVGRGMEALADTRLGRVVQQNVIAPALTYVGEKLGGQVPVRSLSAAAPNSGPLPEGIGQSLVNRGQSFAQPARSAAIEDFATTLQKSSLTPEQVAAELERLGPEGLFVDVNRQLEGKGRGLANLSGQTQDLAKSVMQERARGRPERMISAFEGAEPPPPTRQLENAFTENTRAVGQQAYQGDMVAAGLNQSPELRALLDNPIVNSAIEKVTGTISEARQARPGSPAPSPIEVMHMVKQEIQNLGYDQMSGRPLSTQQVMRDLANYFVSTLKSANPALAEADRSYAQAASLPEFFARGRNFMAGGTGENAVDATSAALAESLSGANPQQALAARSGATTAARDLMSGMGAQGQTQRIIRGVNQGSDVRARLGELYGTEHAGNIVRRSGIEQRFMDTEGQFLRQSSTARQAAEIGDIIGNPTLRVGSGGITGYARERLADFWREHFQQSQVLRDEYGRLLFSTDPATRREALRIAEELLRQRAAGTSASTATGAALGSQLAR